MDVLGWDVGGANVKAAFVSGRGGPRSAVTVSRPFEIWKDRASLPDVVRGLAAELPPAHAAALTMTAELSDAFRTKREGVAFVVDAVAAALEVSPSVFTTAGTFVDAATARAQPVEVAASNWMATALVAASRVSNAMLVDVGSTTADVIPLRAGRVVARGRTDPERLLAGELVYTGATRTNVAAIVSSVPLRGGRCPVASELFAVSGDVHVLLGALRPSDYTSPTPDGRPPTPAFAAERLARVVCADVEMLSAREIRSIARAIAETQVRQIATAMARVARRFPAKPRVLVTGLGAFLGRRAARVNGLRSRDLSHVFGVDVGVAAPAVAVAWLLAASKGQEA
jgi:(4-(4-[2-(gamma-L-glutamylamino)ethyl]phenoxymethyl)furan-2-yl)methanamine synthase